eukprot:3982639-Amphidinium_carterae.1
MLGLSLAWWAHKKAINSCICNAAWRMGLTNQTVDIWNNAAAGLARPVVAAEQRLADQATGVVNVITSKKRSAASSSSEGRSGDKSGNYVHTLKRAAGSLSVT